MVGSKINSSTSFSWADEVEKEEHQAARAQQKQNPFGSARPREVVLEEKGIDWRKLDQKLHEPSELRNEKQPKEQITTPTGPVLDKQIRPSSSRGVEGNNRIARNGCKRNGVPASNSRLPLQNLNPIVSPSLMNRGLEVNVRGSRSGDDRNGILPIGWNPELKPIVPPALTRGFEGSIRSTRNGCERNDVSPIIRNQNTEPIVPPLRFPPKNVMHLMSDVHWSSSSHKVRAMLPNLGDLERHGENRISEHEMQLHNRFPNPHCYRNPHENHIEWEEHSLNMGRRNLNVEEFRHQAIGEKRSVRAMREPSVREEWEWENMNPNRNRPDFFEEQFTGSLPDHHREWRAADEDFYWQEAENEHRRTNIVADRRMGRPRIDTMPNGGRSGHHGSDIKKGGFCENYKNVRVRSSMVEERECENAEYLYERQRSNAGDLERPRTGTMRGRRAETDQKFGMERDPIGQNRKRGMKPGFNKPQSNQRRKR